MAEIRVGLNALTQRTLQPVAHRTGAIEGN